MAAYEVAIDEWEIALVGLRRRLRSLLRAREIELTDYVWVGPDGGVCVSAYVPLDESFAEYVEEGQVSEYLE